MLRVRERAEMQKKERKKKKQQSDSEKKLYFKLHFHKVYLITFNLTRLLRPYFTEAAGLARDKCGLYGGVPWETFI